MEKKQNVASEWLKVAFYVSLVPYVLILTFAIYNAFIGYSNIFLDRRLYGITALLYTLYLSFGFLIFTIPILPFLLVYQTFYIALLIYKTKAKKIPRTK